MKISKELIKVYVIDLPLSIHGATVYTFDNGQEFYTILLNAQLSYEMLCRAYNHEIEHINNQDFDAIASADSLESYRHLTE